MSAPPLLQGKWRQFVFQLVKEEGLPAGQAERIAIQAARGGLVVPDALLDEPVDFEELPHRHLLDDAAWDRLTVRLAVTRCISPSLAAGLMNEALGYLKLVAFASLRRQELAIPDGWMAEASRPTLSFSPSGLVDWAWHELLQDSVADRHVGRQLGVRIGHEPFDGPVSANVSRGRSARTLAYMTANGFTARTPYWQHMAGPCTENSACTNDGCDSV